MDAKRAARIESLRDTIAFAELADELKEAEERFWKRHVTEMKTGVPVDQRYMDRVLGKFDAIRQILRQPERAARILEDDKAKTEREKEEV